jgi:signal transduction histidine kinase
MYEMPDASSELVLIVDDNETARYSKTRLLRSAGYSTLEAGTGADAMRLIEQRDPRLVVLDVHLPDRDGWSICRDLKADPKTASILVLQVSATFVTDRDRVRALDGGADACLTEPLEGPVLVATVRALLRARKAEDALRDALAREQTARSTAENANRSKDEFLALLSHEVRTPLGAILSWVTLLRQHHVDANVLAQGLEAIERNARVQVKLIEDLLDVSRIVTGKLRLDLAVIDLALLIEGALESVRPAAIAKGIRVDTFLDPALGSMLGDPTRLQQVLWNLVSNAVKFTPKGGWIEIRAERRDSLVVVELTDSGQGVDAAFLPFIFDRFRQADSSTTRREAGLGLGLAIVRHIIELHGGTVEAESDGIGQGSTFVVRLPVAPLRDVLRPIAAVRAPYAPAVGAISPSALAGVELLVVDDDRDAREAVGAVLKTAGATVNLAASVDEALTVIRRGRAPNVIVSDIAMPDADGFDLIRELRQVEARGGHRVRALALTAYAGEHEGDRIHEAGFDDYLAKPIEAGLLIAAVARLVTMKAERVPHQSEVD